MCSLGKAGFLTYISYKLSKAGFLTYISYKLSKAGFLTYISYKLSKALLSSCLKAKKINKELLAKLDFR